MRNPVKEIERRLAQIRQAFRGVLALVNAAGSVQLIQGEGLSNESIQDAELFQHYGFTSNPLPGTMAVVLPIGGKTSHGIAIATEHGSYRLKGLKSGEVALYTDEGDTIILKRGRLIEVTTETFCVNASKKVELNTPLVSASARVEAGEDIIDRKNDGGKSMASMRELYDRHTHLVVAIDENTKIPTQLTGGD